MPVEHLQWPILRDALSDTAASMSSAWLACRRHFLPSVRIGRLSPFADELFQVRPQNDVRTERVHQCLPQILDFVVHADNVRMDVRRIVQARRMGVGFGQRRRRIHVQPRPYGLRLVALAVGRAHDHRLDWLLRDRTDRQLALRLQHLDALAQRGVGQF